MLLYADDLVLIAESEDDLQALLNCTYDWCLKWKMNININKSNVVHFRGTRKKRSLFHFKYGNVPINYCSSYKYLGVHFDEHLKFTQCASTLADSAYRSLGFMISKIKNIKDVRFKTYTSMYNSYVAPILDYCSSIWGFKNSNLCDNVQNKAIRYFLGVHKFTPIPAILGEMGWLTCKYRQYLSVLRLWNRLIKMDANRLTKRVFLWDYDQSIAGNNWSQNTKEVLTLLGMEHCFSLKTTIDIRQAKSMFMQLLENNWKQDLESKPKLRLYKTFKNNFDTERYLHSYISKSKRSLLVQFRTGVLPLRIETGRFHLIRDKQTNKLRKLSIEERTCLICNSGEIEDEIHFLCNCKAYEHLRNKLFKTVLLKCCDFLSLTDDEKLVVIVNHFEKDLVEFISNSWKLRENLVNK